MFADIICPFAYVGLTRLIAKRDELARHDVRFRIRSWPLELVNGKPVDAHFIGEEVDEMKPQVAPDLFAGFNPDAFPTTTLPALALTAAAYAVDDATGESVAMEVRRLVFEHGRDVSDPAVLGDVAQQHGLVDVGTTDTVLTDFAEGRARGVIGSPHFFVEDTSAFCPVLDIKRVDGLLQVRVDQRAYADFIAVCFA